MSAGAPVPIAPTGLAVPCPTVEHDPGMLERHLFTPDGRIRVRRMIITVVLLVAAALLGSVLVVLTPIWNGQQHIQTAWVIFAVFVLKFPLVGFCWWLIVRNKEWPGRPVVWSADETGQILEYLRAEARRAMDLPDASARLTYLSGEAWHVADRAEGTLKADAVGVALEIDRLLRDLRRPGRRTAGP